MKENESFPINEKSIDLLIEQIRISCSHMLNTYLQLCMKHDQFRVIATDNNSKKNSINSDHSFYDENNKIRWDIIRNFMPPNIEKHIKEEYSMLNDNEIRLCCLLFFNLPIKNITYILPYKKNSVYSVSFMVKQKMGIKDFSELYRKIILKMISNRTRDISL